MSTALAIWLWTGPNTATTRLHNLLTSPDRTPPWKSPLNLLTHLATTPTPARRADAWRRASIELCQSLAAELSAGRTPGESLTRAMTAVNLPDPALLRPVIAAARDGGDVCAALTSSAPQDGGEGLRHLAACWEVSTTAGAGLASLVDRVAHTLRAAQTHRQDVAAQLAGPRTTARLLAALPALGLLMAAALNMRPLSFLFGTIPGFMCLLAGITLDVCGLWWTNRMATRAQT
ncbi:type II secretion system F family protein [Nonomuraea gerenzanensis]|uniref:type II secretion system F family protein n=1 Tax=Nonomuraea gerenzanensis TaxID=93944 RepID=UPI001CD9DDAF|nr:type II secretion system F family protein [Nonomuraea gerenzanensis]UBU13807.1 type II secretion system F family protein [Nonomuraea gerenzanensis]